MNDHDAIAVANKNRSVTLQMITMQLIAVYCIKYKKYKKNSFVLFAFILPK